MNITRIRIKDIARLAGVSEGTVDRILHNRGKVSDKATERVNAVLKKINYTPNLIARSLSSPKKFKISVLIPHPESDPYWKQSEDGLKAGLKQLAQFSIDITIETTYYDLHNNQDFKKATLEIFQAKPDGVLVAPLFYFASIPFFKSLSEAGIPFVLFNTHINEVKGLSFIGQDLLKSGMLSAELISIGQPKHSSFVLLHIDEDISNSIHLKDKEEGFFKYLNLKSDLFTGSSVLLAPPNSNQFDGTIKKILDTPNLSGVVASTSKAFLVADLIKSRNPNIRIVGYDLITPNIELLKAGKIDFLINQNPMRQARLGIQTMANYLLFKKKAPTNQLFPLDVISSQNVDSYLSHQANLSGITV